MFSMIKLSGTLGNILLVGITFAQPGLHTGKPDGLLLFLGVAGGYETQFPMGLIGVLGQRFDFVFG